MTNKNCNTVFFVSLLKNNVPEHFVFFFFWGWGGARTLCSWKIEGYVCNIENHLYFIVVGGTSGNLGKVKVKV